MNTATPSLRLLHLEDNRREAELIHALLLEQWPDCLVNRVDTRDDFVNRLHQDRFDLILSDFTMPAFNALDALEICRQQDATVPFIILSGTIGEDNAVLALQRGAVDYVIKDRPARLIPAIQRALALRRERQLRQEAELRLREQAGVLDKAREAILVTDLQGRITYRNESATRLLGWIDPGISDCLLPELVKRSGPGKLDEVLQQLHASGTWTGDIRLAGPDNNLRHIESRWTLVQDDAGRPKSILLINSDVTEQKQLEARLLRSQRMESIGTLAGGIAHDLNNALSPITMAANLLRTGQHDADMLRLVDVLEASAAHGSALIRQLLAFARGAEGEHTDVLPQTVIHEVVKLLGDTLPRSITIETRLARDLRLLRGNSTQLVQVLMNLGINARDAMPKGGRLIFAAENVTLDEATAQANPGTSPGCHVRITVTDTGSGIPPELLNRIFDPFFTTKAAGKGMGLGLSTVLGIVKGHHGFLQVQSELGRGTEFRLYLPAEPEVAAPTVPPPAPASARGNGESVLLIDDVESVRETAALILRAQGYNVITAPNGLDGLILYRKHQNEVQVVVTDMIMPGLQGPEVIREVQRINADARIVAMSGIGTELANLRQDPARLALLVKPMTAEELIRAVQSVLPAHRNG